MHTTARMDLKDSTLSEKHTHTQHTHKRSYNVWFSLHNILKMTEL